MSNREGDQRTAATDSSRSREPAPAGETGWRRLMLLPFLQRCVLMADVLGPPGGLRGP